MEANRDRPMTATAPTAYGRACTSCSRAKSKCISRSEGSSCERCHRLKKDCVPSVSTRKRGRKTASSTAQLQNKLDDLVTLFRKQQSGTNGQSNTPAASVGTSLATPALSSSGESIQPLGAPEGSPPIPQPPLPTSLHPPPADFNAARQESLPACSSLPTDAEAEESLAMFRDKMLHFFPFVYIPVGATAKQIRQVKPLLWFSIMALASRDFSRQLEMIDAIPVYLAQKVVVDGERSIDLLLMILTYIAWSQYNTMKKRYIVVTMGLAQSIITDLSLNKPSSLDPMHMVCWKKDFVATAHLLPPKATKPGYEITMEDRRSVLAFFYMSTLICHTLKKPDQMRWTSQMDAFLQVLTDEPEWQGDGVLAAMVRIQLIAQHVNPTSLQPAGSSTASFILSTMRKKLEDIDAGLSLELQKNGNIVREFHFANLLIHEAAMAQTSRMCDSADLFRLETLNASLDAAKGWLESYLTLPISSYIGLTFAAWCHVAHALLCVFRHMVDPEWDRAAIRRKVDIFGIVDTMLAKFEEAGEQYRMRATCPGMVVGDDAFSRGARIVKAMRNGWETEIAASEATAAGGGRGIGSGNVTGTGTGTGDHAGSGQTAVSGLPPGPGTFGDGIQQPGLFPIPMYYQPDEAWLTDLFTMSL